ncbi:nucleolar RNA helicase 2 [Clonorchis sinensis]|uniref:Nucleolar RNA helicase 2 n=1 Tax=Clonorchis sinensis TaxID=79923 RepID=G7Y4P4_CLOSI|nr:nucleolar RNA helicase 2 [Clonorchis sinensis]
MAGADVVVLARTGTGKTLAFTIPITEMLLKNSDAHTEKGRSPKVLVLAPTRELVTQISSDFQSLCEDDFSVLTVYGGVPLGPQCNSLRRGVDVLIGTPGRVIDLMERGVLCLDSVKHVVLDEVDRMLDMGFHKDVESIIAHLYEGESRQTSDGKPQTLLFSATMAPWVSSVAKRYLSDDTRHISFIEEQQNKTALNVTVCSLFDHGLLPICLP